MNKTLLYIIIIAVIIFVIYKLYKAYIKMDISQKGIAFIRLLETNNVWYNTMIKDSLGLPTIGVGHLIRPNEKFEGVDLLTGKLTNEQVDRLFKQDLKMFVDAANNAITVPLSQNEFDAVVSILFNIGKAWGDGIGSEATFIKLIDSTGSITGVSNKSKEEITKAIMKFKFPPEIITRRAKEARLYAENDYSMNSAGLQKYIDMTKLLA